MSYQEVIAEEDFPTMNMSVRKNGVIRVKVKDVTLTKEHAATHIDAINRLTKGKPHQMLVLPHMLTSSTREHFQEIESKGNMELITAEAIVCASAALKMTLNLFIKLYGPKRPIQFFNSEEDALMWLEKERRKKLVGQ